MPYLRWKNLAVLQPNNQVRSLMSIIRDKETKRGDFVFYADRLIRLLVEKALEFLPVKNKVAVTPLDEKYNGVAFEGKICAVSIVRAGESMEKGVRDTCRDIRIGKILIQRDEKTAEPKFYYEKLPLDIKRRHVLLLDPMLATGGSIICAIKLLIQKGVPIENIIFINLIACFDGLDNVYKQFPNLTIVTAEVDEEMNKIKYIIPGLGDFGNRYFGTDDEEDEVKIENEKPQS